MTRAPLLKSLAIFLSVAGISAIPGTIAHEVPRGHAIEDTADTKTAQAPTDISKKDLRSEISETVSDPPIAVELLEQLSEDGDAQAKIKLARSLIEEFREQTESAVAAKAAENTRNDTIGTALLSLGDLYMDGKIDSAAGQVAFDYYVRLLESGAQVVAAIQPGELISLNEIGVFAPDRLAAEQAYLKAAGLGQSEAYLRLSDLYQSRSGIALDAEKAVAFLRKAVDLNNSNAVVELSLFEIERNEDAATLRAAFSDLETLARDGNANAQYGLGRLLLARSTLGQQPDPDRAVSLIQRAAKSGHAGAMLQMAQFQIYGSVVPRNPAIGLLSLQKLADAGFADAMLALGDVYSDGVDGTLYRDPALAFRYYTQAADAGSDSAMSRMAGMLLRGEGVARDVTRGLALLEQGATAGNASALLELGAIYRDGETEGVPGDALRAFDYFQQAADLGDPRAILQAALMQLNGPAGIADPEAAVARLTPLAAAGDVGAAYNLAEYYAGAGEPALAFRYYTQAADAGSDSAMSRMAGMLLRNEGVARDVTRGLALLEQGAAAGNASALLELGDAYARGQTGTVNITAAIDAYEAAADLGNTSALMRLANIYRYGLLSTTSKSQAFEFLEKAVEQGDEYAQYMMGQALVDRASGGSGNVREGIDLLIQAATNGIPDAAAALALLDQGAPEGMFRSKDKIDRLRELAATGNIAASLKLIEAYRVGYGGRTPGITARNLGKARKELDLISDRIDPAEYEIQRLLIDLQTARRADFPDFFDRVKKLAPSERPGAIRRILQMNPNAFVYLVQLQLADEGYYNGRANGLMTSRTIKAIQGLCTSLNARSLCRYGPLSPQAYTLLFYVF